jgi:phosphatidylserine decarboxylase
MCSPADGKVTEVYDDKIHILIRIHDVHIIRAPLPGTIESITTVPGNTTPCVNRCSSTNRHKVVTISTPDGDIDVLMIHGAITKVINVLVSPGDTVEAGARIGHILLGSGCITDIPPGYTPIVKPGDLVYAGSSPIAIDNR